MIGTFIMYTIFDGELERIIGPFFYAQKEKVRQKCFQDKEAYIMEEMAFAAKFGERYQCHIREAWINKLYCYMFSNSWLGAIEFDFEKKGIKGSWFVIYEVESAPATIQLNIQIDSNPFHVARLKQDLLDLEIIPVALGKEYFKDHNDKVFIDKALIKHLASLCIDHSCLS